MFYLHFAFGEAARPDKDLPGNADQIGGGEFRPGPLIEIVVERIDAFGAELSIQPLAGSVGVAPTLLEIEDGRPERRNRFRPFDASLVMESFDDGGNQPAWADAVGAHMDGVLDPVRPGDHRLHRLGIFGAEIENVPDLDTAGGDAFAAELGERSGIVLLRGSRIKRGPFVDDRLEP